MQKNIMRSFLQKEPEIFLKKIWCKYHLLAAYELEQNEDKIKECLVYLDQHGNNTYMAKIAREKRKSMDI
ncbi:MAG: hypothetical protein ACLU8S_06680 [Coprococcus phoceensis]